MHEERIFKRKISQMEGAVSMARSQAEKYLAGWVEGHITKIAEVSSEYQTHLKVLLKDGEALCLKSSAILKRWNEEDAADNALFNKVEGVLRNAVECAGQLCKDVAGERNTQESWFIKKKMSCLEAFKTKAMKLEPKKQLTSIQRS